MGRGVNVLGYDPIWKDRSKARFRQEHFQLIREGGFQTVRLNLHAFEHMDAQNRLDPAWLETLDWAVRGALDEGLMVILDEHDFVTCGENPAPCRPKLMAFWRQIAERYKEAPDRVIFEILNEPNKGVDPLWNEWLREALAIIRQTNPTRTVIVGPAFWNNISWLDRLSLPENDRNIVVTVHYYLPMEFTHQGASWTPEFEKLTGVTWGTAEEQARLRRDFQGVQAWSEKHRRPILLGEFGAYDKADMASRARYTAAAARTAECLGWAWAYWQFDSDFIVYDIDTGRWVEPIKTALTLPPRSDVQCPAS